MLYTEADLEASMEKIEVINFHEEKDVGGVRFWAYNAGHVLGAAMFMIEIAGVKVLYTGDFSRQEDRHLMAAEIPTVRPDILITVSSIFLSKILFPLSNLTPFLLERNLLTELTSMRSGRIEKAVSPVWFTKLSTEVVDAWSRSLPWVEHKSCFLF